MSDSLDNLGGRLPLLRPDELKPQQSDLYNYIAATLVPWANNAGFVAQLGSGELVGPFNTFLATPEISRAYLDLVAAEWKHTKLDKRVREVIILTVGAVWNSAYELYAHAAVARHVGISREAVDALAAGASADDLAPDEAIAHRFVKQLCSHYRVEDDIYHEAERTFGTEGVMNMIQLAGLYLWTSAILNGFNVSVPSSGG